MKCIANTAESIFRTGKALIFSWVYQCNCTDIDLSKKTPLKPEIYVLTCGRVALSVPGLTGCTMFRWFYEFRQHPDGVGVWVRKEGATLSIALAMLPLLTSLKRNNWFGREPKSIGLSLAYASTRTFRFASLGCQVQRSFSGVHEPCVSEAQTCT